MGLFNSKPKQQTININGYIIDEVTGMLLDVPKGLKIYNIPKEVKCLKPDLNFMTNPALVSMLKAEEIIFADGSIDKIPDRYFTFSPTSTLKKITLPNGIKSLGNDCIDLVAVQCNFPDTLQHLGKNMYPVVQRLVIGNNITSLGDTFASHDTNLQYVEVSGSIKELPNNFINQCKNIKQLVLREGIEKAGTGAFRNLNSLEYVELPESFKGPFITAMESRPGNNKRGNSKYDGSNFAEQQNNILTIKKIHNGIPYIFQIRRGDFNEISFQGMTATISSTEADNKSLNIDLSKISQNVICQVNIRESTVKQVIVGQPQQQPNNQPQQQAPQNNPAPSNNQDSRYTDEEIRLYIDEIFKDYIFQADMFKNVDYMVKSRLNIAISIELNKRILQIRRGSKLDCKVIYDILETQIMKMQQNMVNNLPNTQSEDQIESGGRKM